MKINKRLSLNLMAGFFLIINFLGCVKKVTEKGSDIKTIVDVTVKGKITSYNKENILKGAYVYVYADKSTDFKDSPFLISEPTDENGRFSFTIPAGKYYLVARKFLENTLKISDLTMKTNEYYCYYGGNPVAIYSDSSFFIGFNCSKITREETIEPNPAGSEENKAKFEIKKSGIKGTITYVENPLSDAYVFVYQNSDTDFRGPVYMMSLPSDTYGNFQLDVDPGNYYVLMKKKKDTDPSKFINIFHEGKGPTGNLVAGPLSQGDYFYFYNNNPVKVTEGNFVNINMPSITKITKEDDEVANTNYPTPTKIEGVVKDKDQNSVAGTRVFAFRRIAMGIEKPAFISNLTRGDGKYIINFTEDGLFYLVAKDFIGRPAKEGDIFGYYFGTEDHSVIVKKNTIQTGINLKVWKIE